MCICIYICIYIYIYIHKYIHHTYIYIHTYINCCSYICVPSFSTLFFSSVQVQGFDDFVVFELTRMTAVPKYVSPLYRYFLSPGVVAPYLSYLEVDSILRPDTTVLPRRSLAWTIS